MQSIQNFYRLKRLYACKFTKKKNTVNPSIYTGLVLLERDFQLQQVNSIIGMYEKGLNELELDER